MKAWMAAVLAAWICVGCAQHGTPTPRTNDGSSITMYGTIDQGITFRK
ncbi:MAG TPA: hypothetical protein VF446_01035 [Trinickia sp.]